MFILGRSNLVVSYSISTSNHNLNNFTFNASHVVSYSISTSNHNINGFVIVDTLVVSYSISTSNHNPTQLFRHNRTLYLIPFLHQTTTSFLLLLSSLRCILFHFYIKPQHGTGFCVGCTCCILFHFYIKPQQKVCYFVNFSVVSYSISTSNHNQYDLQSFFN